MTGFFKSTSGLGLQVSAGSSTEPTAGTEYCCALTRPGFNSDNYLSGDTSVEAMNFAVFEFDTPVQLNFLTVDDVSNYDRSAWMAVGSSAPDLSGNIETALSGFTIINAPDTLPSDGLFTTTFPTQSGVSYLLIGAPPATAVTGITVNNGAQFYIHSFGLTPVPLPATLPLFLSALGGLCGFRFVRKRS